MYVLLIFTLASSGSGETGILYLLLVYSMSNRKYESLTNHIGNSDALILNWMYEFAVNTFPSLMGAMILDCTGVTDLMTSDMDLFE